jgi:hypothetical protein
VGGLSVSRTSAGNEGGVQPAKTRLQAEANSP